MADRGHLFVIDGDLTKVACDAWLLPTDADFDITDAWVHVFPEERMRVTDWGGGLYSQRLTGASWPSGELGCVTEYGEIDGCHVFLANIGHSAADPSVYSGAVLEFVRRATARCGVTGRLPRFAINQIGSGHGGGKQVRGGILDNLISAIENELNSGSIRADIILTSWGEKAEAAAQYMRLAGRRDSYSASPQWHFSNSNIDLHRRARDLAMHFKARNACIFMGAGASAGAGIPTWSRLLEVMSGGTTLENSADFAAADVLTRASMLKGLMGAEGFAGRIDAELSSTKFSLLHGLLSSLPCTEYITTNVEQLFEKAATSRERGVTILPATGDQHMIGRWLLKIHGCVSEPASLVFTKEDYDGSVSSRRALFGVLQAMLLTRHIVFVGYSLSDPDFLEIVQEVKDALTNRGDGGAREHRKLGTVITLFTDSGKNASLGDLFEVVPISPLSRESATDQQFESAVRDLERFIDLVGMLSSDRAAFLLDSRYEDLLDDDERKLAEFLRVVADNSGRFGTSSGWDQVWELLRSLGAHPDSIGRERPGVLPGVPPLGSG